MPRTSEPSRNNLLVLLSGEASTLPEAEARALILAQDTSAKIEKPEECVLVAHTTASPEAIAKRVAFSRRVGELITEEDLGEIVSARLRGSTFRITVFHTRRGRTATSDVIAYVASKVHGEVDLESPDYEITVVCGGLNYYALTKPKLMRQDWIRRRPRGRAYFHPAAIYPKLSRCLVNLTRVGAGEIILDPFVGTGSLLLEADIVGANAVGMDVSRKMTLGAIANQRKFGQEWLGVIQSDSRRIPLRTVHSIVTDVPYGRASSTTGSATSALMDSLITQSVGLLERGRRLVVMHPLSVPAPPSHDFEIEEQHQLYIHRKLTRAITVLRRA